MLLYTLLWMSVAFAISKEESALILKKAPEGWECPSQSEEWLDLGGEYCYIFETTPKASWDEANYQCVRKGGTLASIHSEAETNVLYPHLKNLEKGLFIGLHSSLWNRTVFEWVDGSPLRYTNWHVGEPNIIDEECGEIWINERDVIGWFDTACHRVRGYICSAKKVPPMPNINASVPNECVCTSGMSTETVAGIVICILLIMFLLGVVVYQYRKQRFCKKLENSSEHKDSTLPPFNHVSSEIILKPDEYEC